MILRSPFQPKQFPDSVEVVLIRRWCSSAPSMLTPSRPLPGFCNTTQSYKTVTHSCLIGTRPSSPIHCSQGYDQLSDGWQDSHQLPASNRCCFLALLENSSLLPQIWKGQETRSPPLLRGYTAIWQYHDHLSLPSTLFKYQ